jgi:hypothetical protein
MKPSPERRRFGGADEGEIPYTHCCGHVAARRVSGNPGFPDTPGVNPGSFIPLLRCEKKQPGKFGYGSGSVPIDCFANVTLTIFPVFLLGTMR